MLSIRYTAYSMCVMGKTNILDFDISVYAAGDVHAPRFAIVLPGFLDSKDYPHMHSHVDYLGSLGYFAMTLDFPGTWYSGGAIEDYTVTNCLKIIAQLIAEHSKPTLLIGHSNGGRLALHAAAENPLVKGVVAVMPPLHVFDGKEENEDMRAWRETGIKISTRSLPDDPERELQFELPYSFVQDSSKYKLTDILPTLTVPKLFIAGKRDGAIPPAEVRQAYDLALKPKEFHIVDSGHNYRKVPSAIETVNKLIQAFLKQNELL